MRETRALICLLGMVHLVTYRMTRGNQPLVRSTHQLVADTYPRLVVGSLAIEKATLAPKLAMSCGLVAMVLVSVRDAVSITVL